MQRRSEGKLKVQAERGRWPSLAGTCQAELRQAKYLLTPMRLYDTPPTS